MIDVRPETEAQPYPSSWRRFVVSFVVLPFTLALLLVGLGIHVGARNPMAWYTATARFVAQLFSGGAGS